jgi:hypothetical protein
VEEVALEEKMEVVSLAVVMAATVAVDGMHGTGKPWGLILVDKLSAICLNILSR